MKPESVKPYKERLLALRARLRGDVRQMAEGALECTRGQGNGDVSTMPIHMADIGSDNFEKEFTLGLMESADQILRRIEDALERIEDGKYGVCDDCEKKIRKSRLNAIPYAIHCVGCAANHEHTIQVGSSREGL